MCTVAEVVLLFLTRPSGQRWSLTGTLSRVSWRQSRRRSWPTPCWGSIAIRPRNPTCVPWQTLAKVFPVQANSFLTRRMVMRRWNPNPSQLHSSNTHWPLLTFLPRLFSVYALFLFNFLLFFPSFLPSLWVCAASGFFYLGCQSTHPPRAPCVLFKPTRLRGTLWSHEELQHGTPLWVRSQHGESGLKMNGCSRAKGNIRVSLRMWCYW